MPARPRLFILSLGLALAVMAPPAWAEPLADGFASAARDSAKAAASRVLEGAQGVATFALGLIGVAYRFGGETPDRGLDCSGLVRYVFQQATGVTLPRTARELSTLGRRVTVADLQPGDLVFFNTRRFAFSHVGIYLGDNQFIHAPRRGSEVSVTTMSGYWQQRFNGARRIAGALPSLAPTLFPQLVSSAVAAELPLIDALPDENAGVPDQPATAVAIAPGNTPPE